MRLSKFAVLFAATAIASVISTSHVDAADMPKHTVPMKQPSGWYLRGDIGIKFEEAADLSTTIGNPNFNTDFIMTSHDIGVAGFYGVGIGYEYNKNIRVDATFEYRGQQDLSGFGFYTSFCPFPRCDNVYDGTLESYLGLVNVYYDFTGVSAYITPYIGVGVGGVYHNITEFTDTGPQTNAFANHSDNTEIDFAVAAHAGVTYDVAPNWKIDAGYRFLYLGDAKTGPVICVVNPGNCSDAFYTYEDIISHDFRFGLRYTFDSHAMPSAVYK